MRQPAAVDDQLVHATVDCSSSSSTVAVAVEMMLAASARQSALSDHVVGRLEFVASHQSTADLRSAAS